MNENLTKAIELTNDRMDHVADFVHNLGKSTVELADVVKALNENMEKIEIVLEILIAKCGAEEEIKKVFGISDVN